MSSRKLNILMAAAELDPLVKVGGLADVLGSLPRALERLGVAVGVIIPAYGSIPFEKYRIKLFKKNLKIKINRNDTYFDLFHTHLPGSRVSVYLVRHQLFRSKEIYSGRRSYKSQSVYSRSIGDLERFVFFSKAVVTAVKYLDWIPQVIHCHDWHTALIPTFLDEASLADKNFGNIKTLFTIHNLSNQGIARSSLLDYADLHQERTPALMEDYYDDQRRVLDLMKIGILSADYINTVSPTYAREILTRQYGAGLEKYLQRRKKHLAGILNGIDTKFFDPARDKFIKNNYGSANLVLGKKLNKIYLLKKLGLKTAPDKPLFGLVSRLVRQKGLDILLPALERYLQERKIQVIILGSGQPEYEDALRRLARRHQADLAVKIGFDAALAQQIYAASDFFLMPSQFEPCGLGQMIAMRYASVPLVRQIGGLRDTVDKRRGVLFKDYSAAHLERALRRALVLYKNQKVFQQMRSRIMKVDNSWQRSAAEYVKIYKGLI